MENNICPLCGHELKEKSGVSKKTGQPYNFIGCSNFPECRYIKNGQVQTQSGSQYNGGNNDVMTALRKIYNKLLEIEEKMTEQKN